jgi:hypothetical protein
MPFSQESDLSDGPHSEYSNKARSATKNNKCSKQKKWVLSSVCVLLLIYLFFYARPGNNSDGGCESGQDEVGQGEETIHTLQLMPVDNRDPILSESDAYLFLPKLKFVSSSHAFESCC